MAKKNNVITENKKNIDEINVALGLEKKITGFIDGIDRVAYPVTLDKFGDFIENVQYISPDNILSAFFGDAEDKLREVFNMVFAPEEVEGAIKNVYAGNYAMIITQILNMNGFNISKDNKENDDKESKKK